jgi:hypothetical protein
VLTISEPEKTGFVALYDNGFYNIGVTPTEEDLGVGADDPWGNPLSFTRQEKFRAVGQSHLALDNFFTDPNRFEEDPGRSVDPLERDAVDGAFKTPILRNVDLTGPYMHNGDQLTLEQLVEFYNRGGNVQSENRRDSGGFECDSSGFGENCSNLDPDITSLDLSSSEKAALVAFLRTLTDDRVKWERAPFDHPELMIPLGHVGDENHVETEFANNRTIARDEIFILPAVGRGGRGELGLNAIPEVNDLIACGESDSVRNCFTRFYGDATQLRERTPSPEPTPEPEPTETWVQCGAYPAGELICNTGAQTYRYVTVDGIISDERQYTNAWCLPQMFGFRNMPYGHCEYRVQ